MNGSLLFLCCAVISQTLGYGYYEPRVAVPAAPFVAPVVAPVAAPVAAPYVAPVAAHKHRFTGSLLLSKAKAFVNSDDATYSSGHGAGYGYAVPSVSYARPFSYAYSTPAAAVAVKHGYGPGFLHAAGSFPNRYYQALQAYKADPAAPLALSPYAPVPAYGGFLKYNLLAELARKDAEYRQFKVAESARDQLNFLRYHKYREEKQDQFEDFLRREAEDEEDRQKIREYRRYSKINDYVQKVEKKAEFGALLGEVDAKRREYVFNMVFRVMQFCKCRDAIVDLHRYFSGQEPVNRFGAGQQNNKVNADDTQLFGEGGVIPIPRTPEEARRWFMRGLVNTICDSSKFYVEKVKRLAAQQGFAATFEAQFDNMANGQFQGQGQDQGRVNQDGNYGNNYATYGNQNNNNYQ